MVGLDDSGNDGLWPSFPDSDDPSDVVVVTVAAIVIAGDRVAGDRVAVAVVAVVADDQRVDGNLLGPPAKQHGGQPRKKGHQSVPPRSQHAIAPYKNAKN